MAALRNQATASHLPAVLLFGALVCGAPSLFRLAGELMLPIFGAAFALPALRSATITNDWFVLSAPLLKILALLLCLALLASAAALALRRALLR